MDRSAFRFGWVSCLGLVFAFATAATAATYNGVDGLPGLIPSDGTTQGTSEFTLSVPDHIVISDVNVGINLTHTFTGDLEIRIISPSLTEVLLAKELGGSADNFTDTLFDDEAVALISAATNPFTGSFQPENPLSVFDGEDAFGIWTLRIDDLFGGDSGTLLDWRLEIDGRIRASSVPEPGTLSLLGLAGLALIGIRRRRKV